MTKTKTLAWMEMAAAFGEERCLVWPFAVGSGGYGNVRFNGAYANAHRIVCAMAHGAASTEQHQVAHSCGNKLCCNPKHLRWATPVENNADKRRHGTLMKGAAVPTAKITERMVRKIRSQKGRRLEETAAEFGISKQQVSKIQRHDRWAWLSP